MNKLFHGVVEIIFWVAIFCSPLLIGAAIAFIIYINAPKLEWLSIGVGSLGVLTGILVAERIRRKYGCTQFMSRLISISVSSSIDKFDKKNARKSTAGVKTSTVKVDEKEAKTEGLDEEVNPAGTKIEGLCQVEMGYFQIEDSPIPKDQIVVMYAMHILLNRDLLDNFPDKKYYEKYKALLTSISDSPAGFFLEQLDHSTLQFYCKCGCHSFFVFPDSAGETKGLPPSSQLSYEIAFETNYEEELNVHLFADRNGLLRQVTIYFGQNNLEPIPEDIQVGKIMGVW